jgi:DNA invertase Pin-like site-specific DNA recombinase
MKQYFTYSRVSTTRQGELGVSLSQQADSIRQFAQRAGLQISVQFEEQETAATEGRPIFDEMIRRLKSGEAAGVIIHKIDRSARNLRDWSELGGLIDLGIEVHFANESLDMTSRGGRLSADIQAVVAADFIRNLREETKKGFYGRLKQGFMPMPAPLGYIDNGAAKPKTIDPIMGPLVREAFDLYASGRVGLNALTTELRRMGLRSKKGHPVTRNGVHRMLRNPFYIGIIRIQKRGETYEGVHERLISKSVFDRVQEAMRGKRVRGTKTHRFPYSRLIRCQTCNRSLIADSKKGHTYYRCHTKTCPTTYIREDAIEAKILQVIHSLELDPAESSVLDIYAEQKREGNEQMKQVERDALRFQFSTLSERKNKLTDAYLDGALDRADYEQRKTALQLERCEIEEKIVKIESGTSIGMTAVDNYVRIVKMASNMAKNMFTEELREWMLEALSHRTASGKSIVFTLQKPLAEVSSRSYCPNGSPDKEKARQFWGAWVDRTSQSPISRRSSC